ncbi:MAG TPA: phosphotransferase, partial [Pseudonocardiaceae bacterium]
MTAHATTISEVSPADAAIDLARELGAPVTSAAVLRDGSNVAVLLAPAMLVAKVARRRRHIRRTPDWFAREVAIADYLRHSSVRAVRPATTIPPGPHVHRGHLLTFWDRVDVSGRPVSPAVAGHELRRCHRELGGYQPVGPPFDPCAECDLVLATTPPEQFLAGERELLAALAGPLFDVVRTWRHPVQPLHGDPTPENVLRGHDDDHVWCDFEDTYVGATWWDVACLIAPATVAGDRDFCER